jgi:hypothetical protein
MESALGALRLLVVASQLRTIRLSGKMSEDQSRSVDLPSYAGRNRKQWLPFACAVS